MPNSACRIRSTPRPRFINLSRWTRLCVFGPAPRLTLYGWDASVAYNVRRGRGRGGPAGAESKSRPIWSNPPTKVNDASRGWGAGVVAW